MHISWYTMESIDIEEFIEEIKKRPAIWDYSDDEYKDRLLKSEKWLELCCIFIPNYNEKSENEQRQARNLIQMKWRNVRDAYVRSTRLKSTMGDKVKTMRPYLFANQLSFLQKVIVNNSMDTSFDQTQDAVMEQVESDTKVDTVFVNHGSFSQRKIRAVEKKIEDHIDAYQQEESRKNHVDNEDMAFFISILPTLQTLRREQKLKFRVDVMNLLLNYYTPPPKEENNLQ